MCHPLLNDNKGQFDNENGNFENIEPVTINNTILALAGGAWCHPPLMQEMTMAGVKVAHRIKNFSETFNGDIIKYPRLCLTAGLWER